MTFQYRTKAFHPNTHDSLLSDADILCAFMDTQGKITEGNDGFLRLFDEENHEHAHGEFKMFCDMPQCVERLLWADLELGHSVGAYTLNRTGAGQTYWTYAVISPMNDGYVSAHIKPAAASFDRVRDLYTSLLESEARGTDGENSEDTLRDKLADLGHASLSRLNADALVCEIAARREALHQPIDEKFKALGGIASDLKTLEATQDELMKVFASIRGIPSNMRIVASRLEPAGGPVSAISQNYRLMSDEVTTKLQSFFVGGTTTPLPVAFQGQLQSVAFGCASGQLMREVTEQWKQHPESMGNIQPAMGQALIEMLTVQNATQKNTLTEIVTQAEHLVRRAKDVRQLVSGLDSIRVLCRVEAGRLGAESAALTPVIDQLDAFHQSIDSALDTIIGLTESLSDISHVSRSMQ